MRCVVVLIAVVFCANAAVADELLMEIHHVRTGGTNSCGGLPGDTQHGCAGLSFGVFLGAPYAGGGPSASISGTYAGGPDQCVSCRQLGIPYDLNDATQLARFNDFFDNGNASVFLRTATFGPGGVEFGADELWGDPVVPSGMLTITQYVPRLGFGFNGYAITNITQTLDTFHINDRFSADASQTIRIYGVVPEPATWLLMVTAFAGMSTQRRKSVGHNRV